MTGSWVGEIVAACRTVLPAQRPLALHEPDLSPEDERNVVECLRSGWISTAGQFVDRFEHAIRQATGARHAIATVNGTAALHAALITAGVSPGDEVLVPALTFVATANAVAYCGAIPHFVDAAYSTLGVDGDVLESYLAERATVQQEGLVVNRASGRRLRALVVMHTFGHPAGMDVIRRVAKHWRLALIEDAAESLGSTYKGKHTGTLGDIGVLSFNGNKIVSTGGGGAILTDDDATAAAVRHLSTTARVPAGWHFTHDRVGYNYRMPSINAALGLGQLQRLDRLVAAKQRLARRYADAFEAIQGARFFLPGAEVSSNCWLNALILDADRRCERERLLVELNAEGIGARPSWTPMHRLPMYAQCPRMPLPVSESLADSIVNLPSSPGLAPGN